MFAYTAQRTEEDTSSDTSEILTDSIADYILVVEMAEISPETGQAQRDIVAGPPRSSTRLRMPARKVLEDRATSRQIQEMMHAMDTSQANNKISVEISALKDLIVALSHQVAEITSELTATRKELTATKNELLTTKNEMATKNEMEALKAEIAAMIQTQLSNLQVPASASPSYAAIARTPPTSQPSNLPSLSSRSLTPSTMTDTLYCTIDPGAKLFLIARYGVRSITS